MYKPCTAQQHTAAYAHYGTVKPVASHDAAGQRICEHAAAITGDTTCARHATRPPRSRCAPAAARQTSASCYHMPVAVCNVCNKHQICNFSATNHPICPSCSPQPPQSAPSATRTNPHKPSIPKYPSATPATPPRCASTSRTPPAVRCGGHTAHPARMLTPAPAAPSCPSAAYTTLRHRRQDVLKACCARCSLRRRAAMLLSAATGDVPAVLTALLYSICAALTPSSSLNCLLTRRCNHPR